MDAWISELEMVWNEEPILNDHQNEEINTLGEELALVLGDDFSSLGQEENTISSLLNYCTAENPVNSLDQLISNEDKQLPPFSDNSPPYECTNNEYYSPKSIEPITVTQEPQKENNSSDENGTKDISTSDDQKSTKGGKRKRRDPEQIQDHILAERKRRQTLSQQFIALSALVPNLKKVDKTSILEEAIKHLKQMQEKVKSLEVTVSKQAVRPMKAVKRTQLVVDDENSNDSSIDNTNVCISGDTSDGDQSDTIPEIEVKVSNKTVLLRICCGRRKGILARISKEVENCHLSILNCSVVKFDCSALDITIVAQTEAEHGGYDKHVKNLVRNLNSALRIW